MRWVALLGLAFLLSACGSEEAPKPSAAAASASATAVPGEAVPAAAQPRRQGRPLPAFQGRTLSGTSWSISDQLGKRLLLFLFDAEAEQAAVVAEAIARIAPAQGEHNFEIVGVASSSAPRAKTLSLMLSHGLEIPIVEDPQGLLAQRLGAPTQATLLLADADGYAVRAAAGFSPDGADPVAPVEAALREWLRLPSDSQVEPSLGEKPLAPGFEAVKLGGGTLSLADYDGRPVVLVFFLHTCPHCHHALEAIRDALPTIPEAQRPAVIGVSVVDRAGAVRDSLEELELDFFPVVFDPESKIRAAYGAGASVPVVVWIDAEGRIVARSEGWRDLRDPPLARMRLAKLAGAPVPMLLHKTGFSGNEFCGVCHSSEHDTWLLTTHAAAYDTLVKHGAESDPECVGCHVVGYGETGGFALEAPAPHLEDVGCESCHGRGGPHLSPDFAKNEQYEPVCVGCHDTKHSLGFRYAEFLPQVSHAENRKLLSLPLAEKRALLAKRKLPRSDLLPTSAAYVGSAACKTCHEAEYATWSEQPHAKAHATLVADQEADNTDCLRCHTTAFGRDGGFPAKLGADAAELADHPFAGVGCESCHGPGGDHVGENAARRGTIVALRDKCDSCVILQICGGCHDDANDPGFEFEVQEKIDRQRHGTIADDAKQARGTRLGDGALIGHAFRHSAHPAAGS